MSNIIIDKVKNIVSHKVDEKEYSLYDVEYVKEGTEYFLRVYFDKVGGLTLDDCVALSEVLAIELDKEDFINDKYYLEVSSPGIERELRNIEEVKANAGAYVYIKTYEKIEGQKEFYADLTAVEDEILFIDYKDKARAKKAQIRYEKIAKIRLAVKF